ncbi:PepSY domain-containing protein [Pyruvatibacter sp.]|uniref:PepSY-associated TM helix domain-containing protein n=1 Tax=Pyruvatibacter sp. TaxID=1981328 RepID=UPI0032657413
MTGSTPTNSNTATRPSYYNSVWRWHFYAGLIISPILLIMAVTGGMYLMQPQIEDALYGDLLYLQTPYEGPVDHDAIIATASTQLDARRVHAYQPPHATEQSAQIILTTQAGTKLTAFVDPGHNTLIGTVNEDWRPMNVAKALHGGLMIGKPGEVIVELVASWTLVMVATGLYLWWPRRHRNLGTGVPKLNRRGRAFWREVHAVPGAWAGLWIVAIILSGLPWSVVWGAGFSAAGEALDEGFPAAIFAERPHSVSDPAIAEVSINTLMDVIATRDLRHTFKLEYPWFPNGVYVAMPLRHGGAPQDVAYLFFDKRSGDVLKDLRWRDMGAFGKASSVGVQFHEGRLFGPANQIINLLAIFVVIGLALTGPVMWLSRKPPRTLGAPTVSANLTVSPGVVAVGTAFALFLPLFGLSVLTILVGEFLYAKWKTT